MPDKDRLFAVLQPVGYRWQNDRDGLVEDGTAPACRASAGNSGFHEMNHPVVVQQPVPYDLFQITAPVNRQNRKPGDPCHTLARDNAAHAAVAFNETSATLKGGSGARGYPDPSDGNGHGIVGSSMTVRRLTPRECERLQAFPDDYTLIPWRKKPATECPDGPRYKALGNSMACNCMAWIGERIAAVETNNGADAAPPLPNRADGRPRQRSSTNGGE
jgi:DNA (cytosine-5)-methyltransferase 1